MPLKETEEEKGAVDDQRQAAAAGHILSLSLVFVWFFFPQVFLSALSRAEESKPSRPLLPYPIVYAVTIYIYVLIFNYFYNVL